MSARKWRNDSFEKLYGQRWLIWIMACAAHTIGMFHRAAMAPMADRLMADFDISAFAFGGLGAIYFYVYAAMQLPSGTLADTLGPRKTITTGLLLSGVGSLIMSMAPTFGMLYLGRLVISFGVSIVWLSVIKLVMEWFHANQVATITGISSTIMHFGQIVATTPLAMLIMAVGWRTSLLTIAGVSFFLAVINWFVVKDNPSKIGLPLIVEFNTAPALKQVASNLTTLNLLGRLKIILSNKKLWPLTLMGLGTYGAYATLFYNWTVIYIMQIYSLPRDASANFLLVATIGMMVGAPTVGFLSDRIMRRRRLPMILFAGIVLILFLIWATWNGGKPPVMALYPMCFLMGLSASSMFLPYACVKDVVPQSVQGMALGLLNMGAFVGPAIAQPLFGYILDRGWQGIIMENVRIYPLETFQQGMWVCCVMGILGFVGALLVKETYIRRG